MRRCPSEVHANIKIFFHFFCNALFFLKGRLDFVPYLALMEKAGGISLFLFLSGRSADYVLFGLFMLRAFSSNVH